MVAYQVEFYKLYNLSTKQFYIGHTKAKLGNEKAMLRRRLAKHYLDAYKYKRCEKCKFRRKNTRITQACNACKELGRACNSKLYRAIRESTRGTWRMKRLYSVMIPGNEYQKNTIAHIENLYMKQFDALNSGLNMRYEPESGDYIDQDLLPRL